MENAGGEKNHNFHKEGTDESEALRPPVELPDLPASIRRTYSQAGEVVAERSVPHMFAREEEMTSQEQFSDQVKNEVLVPIRAELTNGKLLTFLKQLNEQNAFDIDKLGVIFLINDNARDEMEREDIVDENRIIARYISLLSSKDVQGLERLDISQEYKDLGKQIIEKDKLEFGYDFLHSQEEDPHFGELRLHLFKLAKVFKNQQVSDNDVVLHLSDVDTMLSNSHFAKLKQFYSSPNHIVNFAEQDFVPGTHEGEKEDDISRDLLTYLDEFRLYRYGEDVSRFLNGGIDSGTPVISGRLSYFFENGEVSNAVKQMSDAIVGEDYILGGAIREQYASRIGTEIGNTGEVYRQHRARTTEDETVRGNTDAEEAFNAIKAIKKGELIKEGFNLLEQGDQYIDYLETQAVQAMAEQGVTIDNLKATDEYQTLLQTELKHEHAKIVVRRKRLLDYIESLAGNKELSDRQEHILEPYTQYFDDETSNMRQQLLEGKTPEQIAVTYLQRYNSFFNPDSSIHAQVARLRALKKYTFNHNAQIKENK